MQTFPDLLFEWKENKLGWRSLTVVAYSSPIFMRYLYSSYTTLGEPRFEILANLVSILWAVHMVKLI